MEHLQVDLSKKIDGNQTMESMIASFKTQLNEERQRQKEIQAQAAKDIKKLTDKLDQATSLLEE